MKEYKKKADMNSKTGKYFLAKKAGKTKKAAAIEAGLSPANVSKLEKTKTYQAIEKKYRSVLLEKISLDQIAEAHADNITQEGQVTIDRGARNKAIEIALNRVEPEITDSDDTETVMFVLKK